MNILNVGKTAVATVLMSLSLNSFAGGGGAGPHVEDVVLLTCRPVNAGATEAPELIYFERHSTEFGFTEKKLGLYIQLEKFELTIYPNKGELQSVLENANQPTPVDLQMGEFFAVGGNLRELKLQTDESHLSLSLIAGALGQVQIQNLPMICSQ